MAEAKLNLFFGKRAPSILERILFFEHVVPAPYPAEKKKEHGQAKILAWPRRQTHIIK